jgi:hypothetical protein
MTSITTGNDLLKFLQELTPEQRKLPLVFSHWALNGEGSDYEETKEIGSVSVSFKYKVPINLTYLTVINADTSDLPKMLPSMNNMKGMASV